MEEEKAEEDSNFQDNGASKQKPEKSEIASVKAKVIRNVRDWTPSSSSEVIQHNIPVAIISPYGNPIEGDKSCEYHPMLQSNVEDFNLPPPAISEEIVSTSVDDVDSLNSIAPQQESQNDEITFEATGSNEVTPVHPSMTSIEANDENTAPIVSTTVPNTFESSIKVDVEEKYADPTPTGNEDEGNFHRWRSPQEFKFHNLSISDLRETLRFCPVCHRQYSHHKFTSACMAKHGKRWCWLCLEVLPASKEEFHNHCMKHHSNSISGDIVGCPYCGKSFDFRQGLNQHIVKVHMAETLSTAVSALSPTTLVDIYTGQSRSSDCKLDDAQYQDQSSSNNDVEDFYHRQQLVPIYPESERVKLDVGQLPPISRPSSYQQDFLVQYQGYQKDITASYSNSTLNNLSTEQSGSLALPSLSIKKRNHLRPSPLIQALTSNTMHTMSKVPENNLRSSNLALENSAADNARLFHDSSHANQDRQASENNHNSSLPYSRGNNMEASQNPNIKLPDYGDVGLNYHYSKGFSCSDSQFIRNTQSERSETKKKYILDSIHDKECFPRIVSVVSLVEKADDLCASYEQIITQIPNEASNTVYKKEQKLPREIPASTGSAPFPTYDIISSSNSNHDASSPLPTSTNPYGQMSTLEQVTSALSEIDKDYSDIELNNPIEVPEKCFPGDEARQTSGGDYDDRVVQLSQATSYMPPPSTLYLLSESVNPDNGTSFNSDITSNTSSKLPDNCGVKRRILMKARLDEQQYKRFAAAAPASSHALVHDLHAGMSHLSPLHQSKIDDTQRIMTFNRVVTDDNIGPNNKDIEFEKSRKQQQLQYIQQKSTTTSLSGGVMAKDPGPFFEQYVKQDLSRNENHLKLLDLARSPETQQPKQHVKQPLTTATHPFWKPATESKSCERTEYKSCARFDSVRIFPSGGGNGGILQPPPPPLPPPPPYNPGGNMQQQQQRMNQWMLPPLPNTTQQHANPALRKPSNPAFWDSLRARLMSSQNVRYNGRSGMNTSSRSLHNKSGIKSRMESIVVENPFEESDRNRKKTYRGGIGLEFQPRGHLPHLSQAFPTGGPGNSFRLYLNEGTNQMRFPHCGGGGMVMHQPDMPIHFFPPPWTVGKFDKPIIPPQDQLRHMGTFQPPILAPQYAEQYQHMLNKLQKMEKSKGLK